MLQLIDVSNFQPGVNWRAVRAAGVWGVYLKATEGTSFNDRLFQAYRREAATAGLRVGAYHFARPDKNATAVGEAEHFCRVVGKPGRRELRPALDLEVRGSSPGQTDRFARAWGVLVRETIGVAPLIYLSPSMIQWMRPERTIAHGLWLAEWPGTVVPRPWKRFVLHQWTSKGHVQGVPGNCDLDVAPRPGPLLAHPITGRV